MRAAARPERRRRNEDGEGQGHVAPPLADRGNRIAPSPGREVGDHAERPDRGGDADEKELHHDAGPGRLEGLHAGAQRLAKVVVAHQFTGEEPGAEADEQTDHRDEEHAGDPGDHRDRDGAFGDPQLLELPPGEHRAGRPADHRQE